MRLLFLLSSSTLIGPWGWLGWALFSVMCLLYIRLWYSSGAKKLRQLNKTIEEAHRLLARAQEENITLQNRNDVLRRQVSDLQAQNESLRQQISELKEAHTRLRNQLVQMAKANEHLRGVVSALSAKYDQMEKRLKELENNKPAD